MLKTSLNTLYRWFTNPLKEAPGPSWIDDNEIKHRKKATTVLEYLSFDSPRLMRKYGGIIRLSKKKYLIADPKAFKYILKTNVGNFSKRNMTYDRIKLIFGKGLIVNEGFNWEKHRALLHPVFERQRLNDYSLIITSYAQELLNQWQSNPPQSVNIAKEMGILTLKIAFKAFSQHEASTRDIETVIQLFERGNPHISFFPFLKPWFPTMGNLLFFHSIRKLNTLLQKIITERKLQRNVAAHVTSHALDILLHAKETHGITLSDAEIVDEYKTLLITGHETTGCGLTWAFYLLAKHPEYRALMEEELRTVLNGRIPTIDDCPNLPVTKAIFLETLRLYPSIWCLPRVSLKNDVIEGYNIPAGSYLILNLYALHRNPWHWEDPEAFYPPRFLGDAEFKRDQFAYLPFSIGPHSCIGSNFGVMEGILLLATIGQNVQLDLIKNKPYRPDPYVSLRMPTGVRFKLRGQT